MNITDIKKLKYRHTRRPELFIDGKQGGKMPNENLDHQNTCSENCSTSIIVVKCDIDFLAQRATHRGPMFERVVNMKM